jgi:hypothetical protein
MAITITGGISGTITLTNGDVAPRTGVGTTSTEFSAGGLTGFTFVNPLFSESFTTGSYGLAAGQTVTFSGLSSFPDGSAPLGANTTSFAPYTGAGFFDILISTATSYTATVSGGSPSFAQSTQAQATAQVTYTYTPAPPP